MKNLADLKRKILPGVRLRCVENTYRPVLNGTERTVTRVQTNGFWWKMEGEPREAWTQYPPASVSTVSGGLAPSC